MPRTRSMLPRLIFIGPGLLAMASGALDRLNFPKELPHYASGRFIARQPDLFPLLPRARLRRFMVGGWEDLAFFMRAPLVDLCSLIRQGPL
eukprot:514840-Heterocapsa_arctica.AAC.1